MPRIIVIGSSCAGKSTLAADLSRRLGIPHIQLDALHWKPGWVERNTDDFLRLLNDQLQTHTSWIIDGNYSKSRPITWPLADTIIWLNYSFPVVFGRAVRRTVRRVFTGETLYSDNKETFRRSFLSRDSILLWVLTSYHRRRREYRARLATKVRPGVHIIELRKPDDVQALPARLQSIGVLAEKGIG